MGESQGYPGFVETGLRSPITEFALSLVAHRANEFHPSGTAAVIAPHLAITAKHVITDYWERYEGCVPEEGLMSGTFYLQAFQCLREGTVGALWDVTRLWLSPHTDVAFLRLTPASDQAVHHVWRAPRMNLLPPPVQSRVSGFGYHSSSIVPVAEDGKTVSLRWKDAPTTTRGTVVEHHVVRRDSVCLTFPCYRMDARFDGGMSGGPIFNADGELAGVICSSMPPDELDGEHTSYAATLWPAMGTVIDMDRDDSPRGRSYPVLELAERGYLRARHWERIELCGREGDLVRQIGLRQSLK